MEEIKILIAEDDPSFASILQNNLVLLGYNLSDLVVIDNVADVAEVKVEFEPDVILLDLNLRDSLGFETYERLSNVFEEVPIIVLSGLDDRNLAMRIVSKGAQDYLLKNEINGGVLDKTIKYGMLRKTFQAKLSVSERKYKDLFHNSPIPMLQLVKTTKHISFCNRAALNLFEAKSSSEILGAPITDFIQTGGLYSSSTLNLSEPSELKTLRTLKKNMKKVQVTLNRLEEDKDALICLIVDKTEEQAFEQRKFEIIAQAEEGEKKKIARELHDGIGQQLVLLNLLLQNLETKQEDQGSLENIRQLLQSLILELRELAYNLLPPALDQGFVNALQRFAKRINDVGSVTLTLKLSKELKENAFKNVDSFNLYRMVQEILNNALKHSQATKIEILIEVQREHIVIRIIDNGIGFDVLKVSEGLGLQNLKYRMEMAGIRGGVKSEPGKGVEVELIVAK
ncbi:MAG: response regulator [Bacteroidetes bacterium]|nr:response regulator [Bacteroidota bacterium]